MVKCIIGKSLFCTRVVVDKNKVILMLADDSVLLYGIRFMQEKKTANTKKLWGIPLTLLKVKLASKQKIIVCVLKISTCFIIVFFFRP
jgi:hypothetical protein